MYSIKTQKQLIIHKMHISNVESVLNVWLNKYVFRCFLKPTTVSPELETCSCQEPLFYIFIFIYIYFFLFYIYFTFHPKMCLSCKTLINTNMALATTECGVSVSTQTPIFYLFNLSETILIQIKFNLFHHNFLDSFAILIISCLVDLS